MRIGKLFIGWEEISRSELEELAIPTTLEMDPDFEMKWEVFRVAWGSEDAHTGIIFWLRGNDREPPSIEV